MHLNVATAVFWHQTVPCVSVLKVQCLRQMGKRAVVSLFAFCWLDDMNLLRDTKNLALSPKQTVFSNYHMLKDMDAADEYVNLRGF